jgi:hypothetical protein
MPNHKDHVQQRENDDSVHCFKRASQTSPETTDFLRQYIEQANKGRASENASIASSWP